MCEMCLRLQPSDDNFQYQDTIPDVIKAHQAHYLSLTVLSMQLCGSQQYDDSKIAATIHILWLFMSSCDLHIVFIYSKNNMLEKKPTQRNCTPARQSHGPLHPSMTEMTETTKHQVAKSAKSCKNLCRQGPGKDEIMKLGYSSEN